MDVLKQLFDHNQVLTKQYKTFIKHQEKAMSKNEQRLGSMLHCANYLNVNIIPGSHEIVEKYLTQLQARGPVCLQMCNRVLEMENKCEEKVAYQGKTPGDQNNESYQSIQQLMSSINDEFDSEVKQLQDMYEQMRKSVVPLNVV